MYRILIADDMKSWQTINTKLIKYCLGEKVQITTASSAQEAYNVVIENLNRPFDLILTDLQMETTFVPETAGEWLIEQIKLLPEYRNVCILVISASPDIQNIAKRLEVSFIKKSNLIASPQTLFYLLEEKNFILTQNDK